MRRAKLLALMITLALPVGCSSVAGLESDFTDYRTTLESAGEVCFTANILASYSENVLEYELFCTVSGECSEVIVNSPELLAGVSARLEQNSTTLEYDGLVLEDIPVDESELTPLSAPLVMTRALLYGHIEAIFTDSFNGQDAVVVSVMDELENCHTIWLNSDTMSPVYAELESDGRIVISCTFSDWSTN